MKLFAFLLFFAGVASAQIAPGVGSVQGTAPIVVSPTTGQQVVVSCPTCGSATPTTLQTNTVNNTSQTTLNEINSSTNAAGLSDTVTNTSGGIVQHEITVSSASTARTALGLGTMATQNVPSNLTITYNSGGTTTFAAASAVFAGGTFTATHSTSTTFSPTNLVTWGSYTAIVKQDSTGGGNTFTLGTGGSCTTWRKPGGGGAVTSLTLSTVANDWDVLAFTFDGTNCILTQGTNY